MGKLFMMDFPTDKVRIVPCYKQEDLLKKIKAESPERVTPPKIADVYGELYFPPAPCHRPYTFAQ